MKFMRTSHLIIMLLLVSGSVLAQKPAWPPVAELLVGSIGEADAVRMSDVMSRCTALNMILAGMVAESSPDVSDHYQEEAMRLVQNSVMIDSRLHKENTGQDADLTMLSGATIAKVKTLVSGYDQWLDHNMASSGSYFNKDFELEMDGCQLASKLMNQMMRDEG